MLHDFTETLFCFQLLAFLRTQGPPNQTSRTLGQDEESGAHLGVSTQAWQCEEPPPQRGSHTRLDKDRDRLCHRGTIWFPSVTMTSTTRSSVGEGRVHLILRFCVTIHHLRKPEQKLCRKSFLAHSTACSTSCLLVSLDSPAQGMAPPIVDWVLLHHLSMETNSSHTHPYTNLI